jgi:hypothetical protein
MRNARGIIALKVYGLLLGVTALGLGLAGVAKSHRHPGVINQHQYQAVTVGQTTRPGVLLYFGAPAQPVVHAAQIDLAEATRARSGCLIYRSVEQRSLRYRFCFSPGGGRLTSKQEVNS